MCSEPVTFGGGMTIAVRRRAGALGPAGAEGTRLLPSPVDAALDLRGLVGLIDHRGFA